MDAMVTTALPPRPPLYTLDNNSNEMDISTAPPSCCPTPTTSPSLSQLLEKHSLPSTALTSIQELLISTAELAGAMMLTASPSTTPCSTTKKNTSDRVTQTDREIESFVASHLHTAYPQIPFLGEETSKKNQALTDAPTFVCDPIDGTLNFIHGFPNTAVSLALTIERRPVVGVVFNPFRGDLYMAVKAQGAFLRRATDQWHRLPLRGVPSPLPSLNDSLVGIEWGNERAGPNWALRSGMAHKLLLARQEGGAMVHSVRSSGSAALAFCSVAAGQLDLFWEGGCWVWDVCAGWIVLEEAGGIVASANPGDWEPEVEGRLYLAVRGAKRKEQEGIVREVWDLMGERRFVF
ncbi:inositol monophosphatase [Corynespora cassiicola Philippines]|uniref:Inositol-1-monophosphatase n=1 Tax=Corynespora cassiicola Philippines TaxID=1448308 RepID=A0A2T2NGE7_CORCC|nr:inositol monophosphatase [Corynespora cassiicola Philippines]